MDVGMVVAANAAAAVSPAAGALAPNSSLATQQFAALMSAPTAVVEPAVGIEATSSFLNATLAAAQPVSTMGNQILGGLRGTVTEFSDKWSGISARLDAMVAQPSSADMLRLQADLLKVSVQYEVVGKAVAKSTQNLDALVRMN
ncbi:type III secretion system inner rod subunit SctI [Achromobacter marplatensis]|uniref:type III secretion system inner rod subunit SctI n=1 Tax=Achromobacter marplatensis TaxID=470868 RepID=UPI0039F723AD